MSNQTENKRYQFRGFYKSENGTARITLNGENLRGEWVYGDRIVDYISGQYFIHPYGDSVNESDKVNEEGCLRFFAFEVIPETIGQWVRLDKNGKDVFVGDRMAFKTPSYENIETGEVIYNEEDLSFELASDRDRLWDLFGYADEFYEIIGNKWEIKA